MTNDIAAANAASRSANSAERAARAAGVAEQAAQIATDKAKLVAASTKSVSDNTSLVQERANDAQASAEAAQAAVASVSGVMQQAQSLSVSIAQSDREAQASAQAAASNAQIASSASGQASVSAKEAADSAAAALADAQTAAAQSQAASGSAQAASDSQQAAQASATLAGTYKDQAQTAQQSATDSATAAAASAIQAAAMFSSTSTSSLTIGTGALSLITNPNKAWAVGQNVTVAHDANDAMFGTIVSYNSTTGALSMNVATVSGSGTYTSWSLGLSPATLSATVLSVSAGGTGTTTSTGTGSVVLNTSPTLITPNLGVPSAATLTNATGLPVSTGLSGLAAGMAAFLTAASSANLLAAVTDETGSGKLVFNTAPALTSPTIAGGTLAGITALGLRNGGTGAFDVTLAHSGTLTLARTLTLNLNDAARSISLSGNLTVGTGTVSVSGSNTGDQDLSGYQPLLVSGTNLKTINNTSLLGAGNVSIITGAAGANTQLQFNSAGAFAADAGLTYTTTTQTLNAVALTATGLLTTRVGSSTAASLVMGANGAGLYGDSSGRVGFLSSGNTGAGAALLSATQWVFDRDIQLGWASATNQGGAADVIALRDAAAVLALRNGTNAQTLRVYNTYTSASIYERAKFGWNANVLEIGAEALGSGTLRSLKLLGADWSLGTQKISAQTVNSMLGLWVGDNSVVGGVNALHASAFNAINKTGAGAAAYDLQATYGGAGAALVAAGKLTWTSGTSLISATADTGIARSAAGVVEVNNGTAGTLADLKVRNLTLTGATTGLVGGADTQVQFNSGGVLAGSSGLTWNKTTNLFALTSSGNAATLLITDAGVNGANIKLAGNGATTPSKTIRAQGGALQVTNDAYNAVLLTLTDAGVLTAGNLSGTNTGDETAARLAALLHGAGLKGSPALGDELLFADSANAYTGVRSTVSNLRDAMMSSLGGFIITGTGVSTGDAAIEVGGNRSDAGVAYLDLHATASSDFDARLIRTAGTGGDLNLVQTGTGNVTFSHTGSGIFSFVTAGGTQFRVSNAPNAVNNFHVYGNAAGARPSLETIGSDANISANYVVKGVGAHTFMGNGGGTASTQAMVTTTSGAVNYLTLTGGIAGQAPSLATAGSDTDVSLWLGTKGAGQIYLAPGGAAAFKVGSVAGAINYFQTYGSTTGNRVGLEALGTDANVGTAFIAKGSGNHGFYTNGGSGPLPQLVINHTASAVNYLTMTGSATTQSVQIGAAGTDANVSLTLNAKGQSVIWLKTDLGTILRAENSSASGATANFWHMYPALAGNAVALHAIGADTNISMDLGVTGLGSFLFTSGSTSAGGTSTNTQFRIDPVANGVNAFSVSGAAAGFAPKLAAVGTDVNVGMTYYTKGTASHQFYTAGGSLQFAVAHTANAVNWAQAAGGAAGNSPYLMAVGADTNVGLNFTSKGTGGFGFSTNSFGGTQLFIAHTASAVNFLQITGGIVGTAPTLSAAGTDTNVGLNFQSLGSGSLNFATGGSAATQQLQVQHTANAVNYITTTGAQAGLDPVVSVAGSDTNIDLNLKGKGTGVVQANGVPVATLNSIGALSFRNKARNGRMDITLRGGSIVSPTDGTYTLDGWVYHAAGPQFVTIAQVADTMVGSEMQNSLRVTVTTANAAPSATHAAWVEQPIEGYLVRDLLGNPIAIRFEAKSSKTGTHCVALTNNGNDRSYILTYTVAAANTWQVVTLTLPGGLIAAGTWNWSNLIGVKLRFALLAGSNWQGASAGSWLSTNSVATAAQVNCMDTVGNIFAITAVQLEKGSVSTSFEHRDIESELLFNRRYARYWGNCARGIWISTAAARLSGQLDMPMRTAPSVFLLSASVNIEDWQLQTYTTSAAVLTGGASAGAVDITVSGFSGPTVTYPRTHAFSPADIIILTAEL